MARVIPIDCPGCGATLEVPPAATETTCRYCAQACVIARPNDPPRADPRPVVVVQVPTRAPAIGAFVVATSLVLLGIAAAGVLGVAADNAPPESEGPSPDLQRPDRASLLGRKHTPEAAPRSEHETNEVCLCRTDLDGDGALETTAQLATRVHYLLNDELLTTYWVDISGQDPWYLPVGDRTAPTVTTRLHYAQLLVACHGSVMAIAADDVAVGWDLVTRRALWTTPLGGVYASALPVPPHEDGSFTFQCTRHDGNTEALEIPTQHGPLRVRIADGAVLP